MGVFKVGYNSKFIDYLLQLGFEDRTGAQGQKGYTKIWAVEDGFYDVWVTINLNKKRIDIYKEYSCGGEVASEEHIIEDKWLTDLDLFIDEVDEILSGWISEEDAN